MPISRAYCRFYTGYYYHIPKLYAKGSYTLPQNYLGEDKFRRTIPNAGQL
jgi:hypothetical protein